MFVTEPFFLNDVTKIHLDDTNRRNDYLSCHLTKVHDP